MFHISLKRFEIDRLSYRSSHGHKSGMKLQLATVTFVTSTLICFARCSSNMFYAVAFGSQIPRLGKTTLLPMLWRMFSRERLLSLSLKSTVLSYGSENTLLPQSR